MDPIELYRTATSGAAAVLADVTVGDLTLPTPCAQWTVQDLIDHLTGGTEYLLAAVAQRPPIPAVGVPPATFADGAAQVAAGLSETGALERMCMSPLGFEWPLGQAVMGTIMDIVIHTWDLATALNRPVTLDPALVAMCIDMFLPDMPEHGRQAGLVGPAVATAADAPPHVRLLGAMGRTA